MLFPLDLTTPECAVFKLLNEELLYFLEKSIHVKRFVKKLFKHYSSGNVSECWLNKVTKKKFKAVWDALPSAATDRQALFDCINNAQDLGQFFSDPTVTFPLIGPDTLKKAIEKLTTHLYESTSKLKAVKIEASQSVHEHYQAHVRANQDSHLCYVCGTAQMSQNRQGLVDNEQWRSAYDHLLNKADYPLYGIHPKNLMPTCNFCNSKAKGAKELIHDRTGNRRKAFYPFSTPRESCDQFIKLNLVPDRLSDFSQPIDIEINYVGTTPDLDAKIRAWDEIFQVSSRVKDMFASDFVVRIASDLDTPRNIDELAATLSRKVRAAPLDIKITEWRFWWHRLYEHLNTRPNNDDIWLMLDYRYRQIDPSVFSI